VGPLDSKAFLPYLSLMGTLTITAKGQVTLRKDILKHLGVVPGERVSVEKLPDGRVEVKAAPAGKISDVFNCLKKPGRRALSVDEMNEIAARGWAGQARARKK
jgi:AbrB family looped-hinge helix DNA binding protein